MAISANIVASSDTLEKLRQEFNNLQSDVDTLNTSGISAASYIFEGATIDDFETTLDAIDPDVDRTVSLPNATTTLVGQDTTDTLTNKTLTAPSITGVVGGTQTSATITTLTTTTVNASGVITAGAMITAEDGHPRIRLIETGVTANNTVWDINANGEELGMRVGNDAVDAFVEYLTVSRTLNVVDEIELNAILVDINANLDVSGTYTGGGLMTTGGNIAIPDGGTIGSATVADAITIAAGSEAVVTFKDDIKIKDGGTIGSISTFDAITIAADPAIVTFKDDIIIKGGGTIGVSLAPTAITIAPNGDVSFLNSNFREQGTDTMWVPVAAMRGTVSNPCSPHAEIETTAGRPDMQVLDFSPLAAEHAQFGVAFPKSWDEGQITFRVFWTSTATNVTGVAWALQGVSVANDATIDVAYGSPEVVTDDNISDAEDCLVTDTSDLFTITGAAEDALTFFRIFRDISSGNDDMTEDARLIGVQIFFKTNAGNDA